MKRADGITFHEYKFPWFPTERGKKINGKTVYYWSSLTCIRDIIEVGASHYRLQSNLLTGHLLCGHHLFYPIIFGRTMIS